MPTYNIYISKSVLTTTLPTEFLNSGSVGINFMFTNSDEKLCGIKSYTYTSDPDFVISSSGEI
jgi:hypothetical protein